MKTLFPWMLLTLSLLTIPTYAWTIGSKGRVNGPAIHTTYFLTPNNASVPVRAKGYVGTFTNGNCQYSAIYDLGTEVLKTGDTIDIDAYKLKSIIGSNFSCITMFYVYKQLAIETIQLIWSGVNYTRTIPEKAEVTIL